LRFANPSPPSGWIEDFHLQAVDHARHTKKDRLAAVSPKSDQVFRSGGCDSGILILATICTKPPGGLGCLTASHSEVRTAGGLLSSVRMLSA
jgi:hypothetical protein